MRGVFAGVAAALAFAACAAAPVAAPVAAPPPIHRADHSIAVYFEHSRSALGPAAPEVVAAAARLILARPFRRIFVTGHADGSEDDARRLSRLRAEAVARALIGHGVDAGRIETAALGTDAPEPGTNGRGRDPVNRRVGIHIFRPGR